jgi:hypothetical protein
MSFLSPRPTLLVGFLVLVTLPHTVFAGETLSTAPLSAPHLIKNGTEPNRPVLLIDLPPDFHPVCRLPPQKSAGTGG